MTDARFTTPDALSVSVRWEPPADERAFTRDDWFDAGRNLAGATVLLRLRTAYWIRYGMQHWWERGETYQHASDVVGLAESTLQTYVSVSYRLILDHQKRLVLAGAPWRVVRKIADAPDVQHDELVCAVEGGEDYDGILYLTDARNNGTGSDSTPDPARGKVMNAVRDIESSFTDDERRMLTNELVKRNGTTVAPPGQKERDPLRCPECGAVLTEPVR